MQPKDRGEQGITHPTVAVAVDTSLLQGYHSVTVFPVNMSRLKLIIRNHAYVETSKEVDIKLIL